MSDSDPGVPGSHWWVTPGGGLDGAESSRLGASRELHEETGLLVAPDDLEGPVGSRVAVHGYSDRILVQEEVFYRARVQYFDPVPAHLTATEQQRLTGFRWFDVDELPEPLWPAALRALVDADAEEMLDLGVVEESTVPLCEAEGREVSAYLDRGRTT